MASIFPHWEYMGQKEAWMTEKELQNKILLDFGAHDDIRLWRVNTGLAIGWSQVQEYIFSVNRMTTMFSHGATKRANEISDALFKLANKMKPTKYGVKGTADIGGLVTYRRSDGTAFGRSIAIEVKGPKGKPTPEQLKWGEMLEKRGGIWILAYSTDDVKARLKKEGFDV